MRAGRARHQEVQDGSQEEGLGYVLVVSEARLFSTLLWTLPYLRVPNYLDNTFCNICNNLATAPFPVYFNLIPRKKDPHIDRDQSASIWMSFKSLSLYL